MDVVVPARGGESRSPEAVWRTVRLQVAGAPLREGEVPGTPSWGRRGRSRGAVQTYMCPYLQFGINVHSG